MALPGVPSDWIRQPYQPPSDDPSQPYPHPRTSTIIPPIPHVRGKHTFHYHGPFLGLLYKCHPAVDVLWPYIPSLRNPHNYPPPRSHGPSKKLLPRPPPIEMPIEWWQAQCAFRGLSTEGTIADMKARISDRNSAWQRLAAFRASLRHSEMKLLREWERRAAEKEKNGWRDLEADEERCRVAPEEFLRDMFLEKKGRMVTVLKMADEDGEVRKVAWSLGLQVFKVDVPLENKEADDDERGEEEEKEKWLVIGKSRQAVLAKVAELSGTTR